MTTMTMMTMMEMEMTTTLVQVLVERVMEDL